MTQLWHEGHQSVSGRTASKRWYLNTKEVFSSINIAQINSTASHDNPYNTKLSSMNMRHYYLLKAFLKLQKANYGSWT
jgi:hypothetical protein